MFSWRVQQFCHVLENPGTSSNFLRISRIPYHILLESTHPLVQCWTALFKLYCTGPRLLRVLQEPPRERPPWDCEAVPPNFQSLADEVVSQVFTSPAPRAGARQRNATARSPHVNSPAATGPRLLRPLFAEGHAAMQPQT